MKMSYGRPRVIDYGSIADCTFATPNNGGLRPSDPNFVPAASTGDGNFVCNDSAGSNDRGGKNFNPLACDMFGEYSHAFS